MSVQFKTLKTKTLLINDLQELFDSPRQKAPFVFSNGAFLLMVETGS